MKSFLKVFVCILLVSLMLLMSVSVVSCNSSEEPPHECQYGEWQVTSSPTFSVAGLRTRTCECGKTETEEIAALGVDGVSALLQGKWLNGDHGSTNANMYMIFENNEYKQGLQAGYTDTVLPVAEGTYTLTETKIILNDINDGNKYHTYYYTIKGDTVELKDYKGIVWEKMD